MGYKQMTLAEFLAWDHGDYEDYQKLITRKHWLWSHIRGASERMLEAKDSMSVFDENEHDHPSYQKYMAEYKKASAKCEKWEKELEDVEAKIKQFT